MEQAMTSAAGKVFGPYNAKSKMTYAKVNELRNLRQKSSVSYRALGALFGIDHKTARSIALGITWATTSGRAVFRADTNELEKIRGLVARGIGFKKIAASLGVTECSVQRLMEAHGIQSINPPPGTKPRRSRCQLKNDKG